MTTKQIPIWIDCDTGTDDTVAIMLAHALPELQIIGLSAVAGNSLLCNTFPNTRRVVHLLGADYPVYPGAERPLVREPHVAGAFHGENGLGNVQLPLPDTALEQTPAWDALYAAAKRGKRRQDWANTLEAAVACGCMMDAVLSYPPQWEDTNQWKQEN